MEGLGLPQEDSGLVFCVVFVFWSIMNITHLLTCEVVQTKLLMRM